MPQVPDWSPVPMSSNLRFEYVLAMFIPYAATGNQFGV
jgi:hypothetical protein